MNKRSRESICSGSETQDHSSIDFFGGKSMHPRSKHTMKHDFLSLSRILPVLKKHMTLNLKWKPKMPKYLMYHFDFTHPDAVYHLSKAILKCIYNLDFYLPCGCPNGCCDSEFESELPMETPQVDCSDFVFERYLAPCVPNRVNYIHHAADLLKLENNSYDGYLNSVIPLNKILTGGHIVVMDIGTGANCIYPLLGTAEYSWNFIGVDIDEESLALARKNVFLNNLEKKITLRLQDNPISMFGGVICSYELICLTLSNPPFHSSIKEINQNPRTITLGKKNEIIFTQSQFSVHLLKAKYLDCLDNSENCMIRGTVKYTFSEDCMEHGELAFIEIMLLESRLYAFNVLWFTSLVAKLSTLKKIKRKIQSDMRLYNASNTVQEAFLNTKLSQLDFHAESSTMKFGHCTQDSIDVSDLHVCEFRTFVLNQGKQTRWVVAWTYYNSTQRSRIIEKLQNMQKNNYETDK
ncbi:protein of unknown function DUF890 domain-containing protein [Theileria equi strain WA]|uniref:Uncharacterized protein n=1 Tax=Theileria equi strain WA TaxID=1537102 RepID=L0B2F4_THEEQ|nr:protein of unknown function DUF890 domain-containing protein [Theileria equi strain WA]AFZ81678.1 protein of unknown function DUF890 domain-containing protein [Theileria equi strain WA]|eukprot:XP_004831344.1 protein of unknown function DUF890 domain-containing protein [Theileria equi strain WA]